MMAAMMVAWKVENLAVKMAVTMVGKMVASKVSMLVV